jgi:hypothetical protein
LVSENKPNLEQILSGGNDAAPVKGGKAPAKGAPAEGVTLNEEDMVIGDKPENNFFVGDAVETIINLNYEARGRQLRPKNPHYLNLKLCFVGYAFAGKKLQAMKLKQEYGLDSFTLNDLVEQALDFFRKNPNPIVNELDEFKIKESVHEESVAVKQEDVPKEGTTPLGVQEEKMPSPSEAHKSTVLRDNPMFRRSGTVAPENEEEAVSEASEIEEELTPEEDFRQCGEKI